MAAASGEWVLETPRLRIRRLRESDLDFVAAMLADPEVMRFWPRTYSREEAEDWIARHRRRYDEDGYGYWRAELRESGEPVGQVGLLRQEFDGRTAVGLGYIIHRPYWRQGYAREGARACLDYGFGELGLREIAVLIRPENVPSRELALQLGAVREETIDYSGFAHDLYWVRRGGQR